MRSAQVHISDFHFEVISPTEVNAYGAVPTTVVLPNGQTVTTAPLIQTNSWVRNDLPDPERPFLIAAVYTLTAGAGANTGVHHDCADNPEPVLCTEMVNELTAELQQLNQVLQPAGLDDFAAFYHQEAALFTAATGKFFRGRDDIKQNFMKPLLAGIQSATVDISQFHFSVINPRTIVI